MHFEGVKPSVPVASLLLSTALSCAAALSPLAPAPDWSRLEGFQRTITREDFVNLLDAVYAPNGAWRETISVHDDAAIISTRPGQAPYLLHFAPSRAAARVPPGYWRARNRLPPQEMGKPLAGLRIALDPGHIGGSWAKMEERWFRIGDSEPVTEGDMTLLVAKILSRRLESLGAQVFLTKTRNMPLTVQGPELKEAAAASLAEKGGQATPEALQRESDLLFYRTAEIRGRARLVNETIRPDVVVALHFNAEPWGDPAQPQLVDQNHLHVLVTGAFTAKELSHEDQRFDMLVKLLNRSLGEELALAGELAKRMAAATGLPPYFYRTGAAVQVNNNPYVWARNLLANRLFQCPVVYVEPYAMNNRLVFARIQAGDYEGTREFGGAMRRSIYREYADAIAAGLIEYYSGRPL